MIDKTIAGIGLIWLFTAHLAGCGGDTSAAKGAKTAQNAPLPVTVTPVRTQQVQRTVELVGTLEANHQVTVAAEIDGQVAAIAADLGDRVNASQTLARIKDAEFRYAVELAEGNLTLALARLGLKAMPSPQFDVNLTSGVVKAKAEFDERFAQQQAEFEQSLATERARWAEEEGRRLAGLLGMRLDELEATIASQVTQILKPVFTEQVRKRAVAELASALESLMANGEFAKLTVSGPEDLLGMLSAQLNVKIGNVAFTPAPGCDLHLTVDQTVLETRIGAWVRAIEGKAP